MYILVEGNDSSSFMYLCKFSHSIELSFNIVLSRVNCIAFIIYTEVKLVVNDPSIINSSPEIIFKHFTAVNSILRLLFIHIKQLLAYSRCRGEIEAFSLCNQLNKW